MTSNWPHMEKEKEINPNKIISIKSSSQGNVRASNLTVKIKDQEMHKEVNKMKIIKGLKEGKIEIIGTKDREVGVKIEAKRMIVEQTVIVNEGINEKIM